MCRLMTFNYNLKISDFGSSIYENEATNEWLYYQSLWYRSPELLLIQENYDVVNRFRGIDTIRCMNNGISRADSGDSRRTDSRHIPSGKYVSIASRALSKSVASSSGWNWNVYTLSLYRSAEY